VIAKKYIILYCLAIFSPFNHFLIWDIAFYVMLKHYCSVSEVVGMLSFPRKNENIGYIIFSF